MKARESGMPAEQMWDQFFDPETILDGLGICDLSGNVVDLGCGYGTFSIPAARKNKGMIYALDIEEGMIQAVQKKASEAGLRNINAIHRDFMMEGTSAIADESFGKVVSSLDETSNICSEIDEKRKVGDASRDMQQGNICNST